MAKILARRRKMTPEELERFARVAPRGRRMPRSIPVDLTPEEYAGVSLKYSDLREGFTAFDERTTAPLRLVPAALQVPLSSRYFAVSVDQADPWENAEPYGALLIRLWLLSKTLLPNEADDFHRRAALDLLYAGYLRWKADAKGKELTPNSLLVACRLAQLNDEIGPAPAEVVSIAHRTSVLWLGNRELAFVAASELCELLTLALDDRVWGPFTGLLADNPLDTALVNGVLHWFSLLHCGSAAVDKMGMPRHPASHHAQSKSAAVSLRLAKRVKHLVDRRMANPEMHTYDTMADLLFVSSWMSSHPDKFVRVALKGIGVYVMPAGALLLWMNDIGGASLAKALSLSIPTRLRA